MRYSSIVQPMSLPALHNYRVFFTSQACAARPAGSIGTIFLCVSVCLSVSLSVCLSVSVCVSPPYCACA